MKAIDNLNALHSQLERVIVGQSALIERLIITVLAGGHVQLERPPGLAKTTAAHAQASAIDTPYQHIQFTPDLMPGDPSHQQAGSAGLVTSPLQSA